MSHLNDSDTNKPEEKEELDEEEAIQAPLVFQCGNCRTILGDSYCFQGSNEDMSIITLTAASNIQRSHDVYTSKAGLDIGSTYFSFACSNCEHSLGKYYLTTSRDLDDLREKFNFAIENVTSYELGKSQHGKMPEPLQLQNNSNNNNHSDNDNDGNNIQNGKNVEEIIFKIQAVLLDHSTRLNQLEEFNDKNKYKRKK